MYKSIQKVSHCENPHGKVKGLFKDDDDDDDGVMTKKQIQNKTKS